MIGRILEQYRIESKLGEGGMGVVYKAYDARLDRPVAIKVLLPEKLADPAAIERFVREARAASALNTLVSSRSTTTALSRWPPGRFYQHPFGSVGDLEFGSRWRQRRPNLVAQGRRRERVSRTGLPMAGGLFLRPMRRANLTFSSSPPLAGSRET